MSALPKKADIVQHSGNVRFVPISDILRCSELPGRLIADCIYYFLNSFFKT